MPFGNNSKIVRLDTESFKQSLIEPADVVKVDDFNRLNDYVRTSFTNLKYDIKHLVYVSESIKKMHENVNNICSELCVTKNSNLTAVSVLNNETPPISNEETINNFEMLLESSAYRDKFVKLSLLVGKTIPETIRRMMQKLFFDDWLLNYSYIGFKGKNKFSSLHSCKIIFEAVRSCSKFEKIPDMGIALRICKWMARATNRINKKTKEKL
ncbi:unnamed protein product [Macrosiphum euphorbiae]|uniref:DUF4806 domain-containing protein n=1 Tax=Macrosiphum euphorbiae TaxID=13131 RepID=A0AAV0XWU3_9HEMI|nr:unnamed protein product [Macrosiphum euphorbiae]